MYISGEEINQSPVRSTVVYLAEGLLGNTTGGQPHSDKGWSFPGSETSASIYSVTSQKQGFCGLKLKRKIFLILGSALLIANLQFLSSIGLRIKIY